MGIRDDRINGGDRDGCAATVAMLAMILLVGHLMVAAIVAVVAALFVAACA